MKRLYANMAGAVLCQAISLNCLAAGAGIVLDGSTTPGNNAAQALTADSNGVINIDASVGSGVGANLFHSFQEFNVDSGQIAEFTDSTQSSYSNVIARVTGNNASQIFGSVKTGSGLENANLYLINPNGILFGEGAAVNVGGAFYASTADTLVFSDTTNQELKMSSNDVNFSSAPIAAFGFVDVSNTIAVSIENTTLHINGGEVGIYADNITIANNKNIDTGIDASNGSIMLNAATANASYDLQGNPLAAAVGAGSITLDGASVNLNGDHNIVLRGGKLTVSRNSTVRLESTGLDPANANPNIDIDIAGNFDLDQSAIQSVATQGKSGDISIKADNFLVHNGASVLNGTDDSFPFFQLDSGDINIEANKLSIIGLTRDESAATGASNVVFTGIKSLAGWDYGSAGNINIKAEQVSLSNNASILMENYGSFPGDITISDFDNQGQFEMKSGSLIRMVNEFTDNSGDLNIGFSQVTLSGADVYTGNDTSFTNEAGRTQIRTISTANANGGDVQINADQVNIRDSALINPESAEDGSGGNVYINANTITIGGKNQQFASLYKDLPIDTSAGIEVLQEGAGYVFGSSLTGERGGNIRLNADLIEINDYGHISTNSYNGGAYSLVGEIKLNATNIHLDNHASISTSSYFLNDLTPTGNITVSASNSLLIENSTIKTKLDSDLGNGGDISLSAKNLGISASRIDSSASLGNGGNITISADFGFITSDSIIDAHSDKNVSGNVSISKSINFEPRAGLTIHPIDSASVRLTDKCDIDNSVNSSLLVLSNNRRLEYLSEDNSVSFSFQFLNSNQQLSINDCLRPALKISLL